MRSRVVVLGAGFGGLELTTILSAPPFPPSPDTSRAILAAFAERGIGFVKDSWLGAGEQEETGNELSRCLRGGRRDRVGTPKAGIFAEGAARVVAAAIVAQLRGGPSPEAYKGAGSCYVEFGRDQVGHVAVDILSGPKPTAAFQEPSETLVTEKAHCGSSRLQRWFARPPATRG